MAVDFMIRIFKIIIKIIVFVFVSMLMLGAVAVGLDKGFHGFEITVLSIGLITYYFLFFRKQKMPCAWCNGKKLKLEREEAGTYFWEYRNKDGSKDKRVKDNYQRAGYSTYWRCKNCSALTRFWHNPNKFPSKREKVIQTFLIESGNGKRIGQNYQPAGLQPITGENRKNR